jgi:hypothetical protein
MVRVGSPDQLDAQDQPDQLDAQDQPDQPDAQDQPDQPDAQDQPDQPDQLDTQDQLDQRDQPDAQDQSLSGGDGDNGPHDVSFENRAPVQCFEFENHADPGDHVTRPFGQPDRRGERAPRRKHIVEEQQPLSRSRRRVHLERRGTVLELVGLAQHLPGEFPTLTNGNNTRAEHIGDRGGKQEPARLNTRDNLDRAGVWGCELVRDGAVGGGIREDRSQVAEEDAGGGEIGHGGEQAPNLG